MNTQKRIDRQIHKASLIYKYMQMYRIVETSGTLLKPRTRYYVKQHQRVIALFYRKQQALDYREKLVITAINAETAHD